MRYYPRRFISTGDGGRGVGIIIIVLILLLLGSGILWLLIGNKPQKTTPSGNQDQPTGAPSTATSPSPVMALAPSPTPRAPGMAPAPSPTPRAPGMAPAPSPTPIAPGMAPTLSGLSLSPASASYEMVCTISDWSDQDISQCSSTPEGLKTQIRNIECKPMIRTIACSTPTFMCPPTSKCPPSMCPPPSAPPPTPVDCQVSYTPGTCDVNTGTQTNTGRITQPAANGGASCPPLSQTQPCAVDCVLGAPVDVSTNKCIETVITQPVAVTSKNGGAACPPSSTTRIPAQISDWSPALLPAGTPCGATVSANQYRSVPPGCSTVPTVQSVPVTAPACPPPPVNCQLGPFVDAPAAAGIDMCTTKTQVQTVIVPASNGGTCNPPTQNVPNAGVGDWSPPAVLPDGTPCGKTITVPQTRSVPPGCSQPSSQTVSIQAPACSPPVVTMPPPSMTPVPAPVSGCSDGNTATWCEYDMNITTGSKAANFLRSGSYPSYPIGNQVDVNSIMNYVTLKNQSNPGSFTIYSSQYRTITMAVTTLTAQRDGISCHDPCP